MSDLHIKGGAGGRTLERTSQLRIIRKLGPYGPIDRLQQAYLYHDTGEIEWRDVPIEEAGI